MSHSLLRISKTVVSTLRLHFRLLEALGILIATLAAGLEIHSLRSADRVRQEYQASIQLDLTHNRIVSELDNIRKNQLTLLRGLVVEETDADARLQITDASKIKWAPVLLETIRNYKNRMQRYRTIINEILEFRQRSNLPQTVAASTLAKSIEDLSKTLDSKRSELLKSVDKNDLSGMGFDDKSIRTIALEIDKKTYELAWASMRDFEDRRAALSRIYTFFFIFGACLLVVSKIGNWLDDMARRSDRQTN
jgi:uncharacterized protein (UPF0335 family)